MNSIAAWLTLKSVPGIGNILCKRLIDHFSQPEQVLTAPLGALGAVEGISLSLARAIRSHRSPDWVHSEIQKAAAAGCRFITLNDSDYPPLLAQIPDPPPLLYVLGELADIGPTVAVVGSRNATAYGHATAMELGQALARHGITVVSGMARGIDTSAHTGALEGGGRTVAVLGAGLNNLYPPQNRALSRRIAASGAVISEFEMDAQPEPHHFPLRNRIISGMSLGTVVVEAGPRSGSLITARLSAEQNREVFAVPGSIHAATTRGTHDLIKQGAKLIENVDDILVEITSQWEARGARSQQDITEAGPSVASSAKPLPTLSGIERQLMEGLGPYPVHIDDLARRLGLAAGQLAHTLSLLELKGIVCQEPGKFFIRHKDYKDSL